MADDLPAEQRLDAPALQRLQRSKLDALLKTAMAGSPFYRDKFAGLRFDAHHDPLTALPPTTREEIERDQAAAPPYGTLLTEPLEAYTRLHQTSGSMGRPLTWLDTPQTWSWWKRCWAAIYQAAGLTPQDRILFPFSFGPFIGFWSAFESAVESGRFVLPAGGMSSSARLRCIHEHGITVVCCTPTYALRLAEIAEDQGTDLSRSGVATLIVAGEPGGNIPGTRARLETAWGARVIDHAGMTEMGAWGFECRQTPGGLHVMEHEFIAEVVDPGSGQPCLDGQPGELLLTNLGRQAMPLIRYRTGDQVVMQRCPCACGRCFAWLEGGIVGRLDDMLIVRGNNVFPAAIENVLREIPAVCEFRIAVQQPGSLAQLNLEVEPAAGSATEGLAERITRAIVDRLHFKPQVAVVAPGSLPRFEMKARRVVQALEES